MDHAAGLVTVGRSEADDANLALADLPFAGGRNDDLVGAAASESSRGVGADRSGSWLVSESIAVGNRVAGEKTYHGRQRGQTENFCTNVHHGLTRPWVQQEGWAALAMWSLQSCRLWAHGAIYH